MVDTIRTEADLTNNIFPDNQAAGSITAQDMRDLTVSASYLTAVGWDFHFDSQYTLASKRAIAAGVRTKVTIDGLTENVGHPIETGGGHQHFWDNATSKVIPPVENAFGIVRLAFTAWSDSGATNQFELELDTGGAFPIIYQQTGVFAKGSGNAQNFNFIIPLFAGPDFVANGGEFYITPQSDASFWEFAITAAAMYIPRP